MGASESHLPASLPPLTARSTNKQQPHDHLIRRGTLPRRSRSDSLGAGRIGGGGSLPLLARGSGLGACPNIWHSGSVAQLKRLKTTEPSAMAVAVVALMLAAADFGSQLAGSSVVPGGPVDEVAHLLTTLLVFWTLGRRARRSFLLPALVASVAIDIDHIPAMLSQDFFTAGTPRPYTHSLLTVGLLSIAALAWRRRRDLLLGMAAGVAIHFVRDLAEPGTGVALLWPASNHSFSMGHGWYVALMGAVVLIAGARSAFGTVLTRRANSPVGRFGQVSKSVTFGSIEIHQCRPDC